MNCFLTVAIDGQRHLRAIHATLSPTCFPRCQTLNFQQPASPGLSPFSILSGVLPPLSLLFLQQQRHKTNLFPPLFPLQPAARSSDSPFRPSSDPCPAPPTEFLSTLRQQAYLPRSTPPSSPSHHPPSPLPYPLPPLKYPSDVVWPSRLWLC